MDKFIIVHNETGAQKILNVSKIVQVDMIGTKPRIMTSCGNTITTKESLKQIEIMLDVSSKKHPIKRR